MNKYDPSIDSEDFMNDISDYDLASDIRSDLDSEDDRSDYYKATDEFEKEFKAVFDDTADGKKKDNKKENNKNKKKFAVVNPDGAASGVYDWIRCVIFAVVIVVFCLTFIFRLVEVDGTSMMDTLSNQDKVIVTDLFYTPHNNDIIVISHAQEYSKPIIKRVIATEGQTVKLDFKNEKIYVDGIELSEPYIKGTTFSGIGSEEDLEKIVTPDDDGNFVIPEGKLFVMGDNRNVSMDSRNPRIGLIDVKNVIGKAQIVAFPFNHMGYLYD